jgi:hypothetical protein
MEFCTASGAEQLFNKARLPSPEQLLKRLHSLQCASAHGLARSPVARKIPISNGLWLWTLFAGLC